jgi:hypothetical protein
MISWLVINSIGLLVLAVVQYVVLRQIGAMLTVLGPARARPVTDGPRIGESLAPWFVDLHGRRGQKLPTLYVFASIGCPACGALREAAKGIAHHWLRRAEIVFVYDTDDARDQFKHNGADHIRTWSNPTVRSSMGIKLVPFAVMTDQLGVVIDQGLINRADHVEEMLSRGQHQRDLPAENYVEPVAISVGGS